MNPKLCEMLPSCLDETVCWQTPIREHTKTTKKQKKQMKYCEVPCFDSLCLLFLLKIRVASCASFLTTRSTWSQIILQQLHPRQFTKIYRELTSPLFGPQRCLSNVHKQDAQTRCLHKVPKQGA